MRMIVAVLTVISVTFAGTTVYLARELQLERERPREAPVPAALAPAAMPAQVSQMQGTPSTIASAKPAIAPPPAVVENDEVRMKRMQAEQSLKLIKTLEDTRQREGLVTQYKMMMRNSYPRLAQTIGLTSEEADRLFTLLAQQQVDSQERYARCVVDSGCNSADGIPYQKDPREREIADLLGTDRQQQFETYKNTLTERESVVQLRTRLSDASRLPDDRAEALITAMADERQKIHQEAAERHAGMNGHGNGAGMIFFASDAATPEAKLESAQANSRRMRERAAEVLTAEQLRVFNEMQDDLLISLKEQIQSKEESTASSYTATIVN